MRRNFLKGARGRIYRFPALLGLSIPFNLRSNLSWYLMDWNLTVHSLFQVRFFWNYKSSKKCIQMYQAEFASSSLPQYFLHTFGRIAFSERQKLECFWQICGRFGFWLLGLFSFVAIVLPSPAIEPRFYSTLVLALTRFSRSEYEEIFSYESHLSF